MTLPNSIISLIQYQPPGPNMIVLLNRFYCTHESKSRDHELVRAQKKVSVQRPSQLTSNIM